MIKFIESAVLRNPKLSFKVNKGGHHRIMKGGWKGSLWIVGRYKGYRVETTGQVGTYLNGEITRLYGQNNGENKKGYKYWYLDNIGDVENIINIYGKISQ